MGACKASAYHPEGATPNQRARVQVPGATIPAVVKAVIDIGFARDSFDKAEVGAAPHAVHDLIREFTQDQHEEREP